MQMTTMTTMTANNMSETIIITATTPLERDPAVYKIKQISINLLAILERETISFKQLLWLSNIIEKYTKLMHSAVSINYDMLTISITVPYWWSGDGRDTQLLQ